MSLREHLPTNRRPDDPLYTTNVMTYELGALVKCLLYARHQGTLGHVLERKAYLKEAEHKLGSLVTQARLLAEELAWSWTDLLEDGKATFIDRMEELRKDRI